MLLVVGILFPVVGTDCVLLRVGLTLTLTVQLGRRLVVSRVISRVGVGTSRVGVGTSRVGVGTSRVGVGTSRVGVGTSRVGVGTSRVGVGTSREGVGTSRVGVVPSRVGVVPSRGVGVGQLVGGAGGAGEAAALAGRQVEEVGGGGGGGLEWRGEDAAGCAATKRSVVDSRRRCNDTNTARSVSASATHRHTDRQTANSISILHLAGHRLPVV